MTFAFWSLKLFMQFAIKKNSTKSNFMLELRNIYYRFKRNYSALEQFYLYYAHDSPTSYPWQPYCPTKCGDNDYITALARAVICIGPSFFVALRICHLVSLVCLSIWKKSQLSLERSFQDISTDLLSIISTSNRPIYLIISFLWLLLA